MPRSTRGFTLIELLVVIAIIGILSSIVVNSVNKAREKGKDAAAKSDLNGTRPQAAIYYDDAANGGSFGEDGQACNNPDSVFDPAATNNLNTIVISAQDAVLTTATCANDASSFVIALPLLGGDTWCVDSTGFSNTTGLALTGSDSVTEKIACQ